TATTAIQGSCQPRPNVRVTTAVVGSGQLQATLAAQVNAATTANSLSSVRFTSIANVAVTLDGSPVTAGPIVSLPGGTQQAPLLQIANAAGLAVEALPAPSAGRQLPGGGRRRQPPVHLPPAGHLRGHGRAIHLPEQSPGPRQRLAKRHARLARPGGRPAARLG